MLSRAAAWLLTMLTVLLCQSALAQAQAPATTQHDWTFLRNDRFGFSLHYPADVFEAERASQAGDGQVFISREGDARLLVGALPNADRMSPGAYQEHIARQSYADYAVTYRRLSGSWFVLSGEGNGKTFYEKVIFSCNGRLINSFAMIYPSDRGATVRPHRRRHREILPPWHRQLSRDRVADIATPSGDRRSGSILEARRPHCPFAREQCHRRPSSPRASL